MNTSASPQATISRAAKTSSRFGASANAALPERRGGHAEQHHALDAIAVDQQACRDLHQGVAPEVARGEHRNTGGVGAEIVP